MFLGGNGVLNCVSSLGSTWLKTEEVTDRKQLHAFTKHPWSSPETKQFSVANTKSRNVGRCCINVLESQCLLYGLDQASVDQFKLPYNGISNAPVYMKINKSVKQNIKCTLLLLIPKEINGSFLWHSLYKALQWLFYNRFNTQTSELYFITFHNSIVDGKFKVIWLAAPGQAVSIRRQNMSSSVWVFVVMGDSLCVSVCDLWFSCEVWLIPWSSRLKRALALCGWPIWTVCRVSASSLQKCAES